MHGDFIEEMKAAPRDPVAANKATTAETFPYFTIHIHLFIITTCEHVDDVLADFDGEPRVHHTGVYR